MAINKIIGDLTTGKIFIRLRRWYYNVLECIIDLPIDPVVHLIYLYI